MLQIFLHTQASPLQKLTPLPKAMRRWNLGLNAGSHRDHEDYRKGNISTTKTPRSNELDTNSSAMLKKQKHINAQIPNNIKPPHPRRLENFAAKRTKLRHPKTKRKSLSSKRSFSSRITEPLRNAKPAIPIKRRLHIVCKKEEGGGRSTWERHCGSPQCEPESRRSGAGSHGGENQARSSVVEERVRKKKARDTDKGFVRSLRLPESRAAGDDDVAMRTRTARGKGEVSRPTEKVQTSLSMKKRFKPPKRLF